MISHPPKNATMAGGIGMFESSSVKAALSTEGSTMANKNTVSKLRTYPYRSKYGPDYQSLPLGKRRKRKIEHVRNLLSRDWSPARVRHYAIHGMNMPGNDVVEAFKDVT